MRGTSPVAVRDLKKQILIVEDEPAIRDLVALAIVREGMDAVAVDRVSAARRAIAERVPDLVLLDWMLPGESGLEFARRLRGDAAMSAIPIIMLSARGDEADRVDALDAGVDDYVVKPFSPRELVARVRALLRRVEGDPGEPFVELGALRIDPAAHRVYARGTPVPIGPTEYRMLHFLMTHSERVHTRTQLLDRLWSPRDEVEERTIDVHVRRLRRTLEPYALDYMVQTVRGAGYRLSTLVDTTQA